MSKTIVSILRQRADATPDDIAFRFHPDGDISSIDWTYSQLFCAASGLAHEISDQVKPGDRVILSLDPGMHFIAALFAILQVGAIAVPSFPAQGARAIERFTKIYQNCTPKLILAELVMQKALSRFNKNIMSSQSPANWMFLDSQNHQIFAPAPKHFNVDLRSDQAIALLQYTSGSTGSPKGVILTHANLLSNSACLNHVMSPLGPHIGFSWLPPYHDMGLMGALLLAIYSGFPLHLMNPKHFIQQPLRWLKLMSVFGVTTTVSPNFALEWCISEISDAEAASLELHQLKLLFCGAEPIREATLDRFYRKFAVSGFRKHAFLPCYGLAEATLFVSGTPTNQINSANLPNTDNTARLDRPTPGIEKITTTRVIGCGRIAEGHEVAIVNPDTCQRVFGTEIGEIWVRGPNIANGYFQDKLATEEIFKGQIASEQDGHTYLRTGDLGALIEGELFVTGRIKEVINLRGRNHYPHDIENTVLNQHIGLRSNGIAAFSVEIEDTECLVIVVEVARTFCQSETQIENLRRRIIEVVTQSHGVSPHEVLLVIPASIPLTTSGKVRRTACRDRYLERYFEQRLLKSTELRPTPPVKDRRVLI